MDMSSCRPMGACIACLVISVGGVCGRCWSWASSACVLVGLGRRLVCWSGVGTDPAPPGVSAFQCRVVVAWRASLDVRAHAVGSLMT